MVTRLTRGFAKFSREWKRHPSSPFFNRDRLLHVWEVIVEQAAYARWGSLGIGDCEISIRKLAELTGYNRRTIERSLTKLRQEGWIRIRRVKPIYLLHVPYYSLVHDMEAYLAEKYEHLVVDNCGTETTQNDLIVDNCGTANADNLVNMPNNYTYVDNCGTPQKSDNIPESLQILKNPVDNCGTPSIGVNYLEQLADSDLSTDERDSVDKSGTLLAPSDQVSSNCNHSVKHKKKRGVWITPGQISPLLDKNISNTNINNTYAQTKADSEGDEHQECSSPKATTTDQPVKSPKPSKRQKLPEPCGFDFDIADTWAHCIAQIAAEIAQKQGKNPPKLKPNIQTMAKVVRDLRLIDGYSEKDICLATLHRFENPFYTQTPHLQFMNLGNIRQVSKYSRNGFTRFENLLMAAQRAKES